MTLTMWLLPWMMFATVFSLFSFYLHYQYARVLHISSCIVAIGTGIWAMSCWYSLRKAKKSDRAGAAWGLAVCISLLLAVGAGALLGNMNFVRSMRPIYDLLQLSKYEDIDPSTMHGSQMLAGGRLTFSDGSRVDVSKAIGVRISDVFCVAPIVKGNVQTTGTYDFWAVGRGCCSGEKSDFGACSSDARDSTAHHGVRLLEEETLPFYKLAVSQAEVKFNISAAHPMFYRLKCPECDIEQFQQVGHKRFFQAMILYLALQAVMVWFASKVVTKLCECGPLRAHCTSTSDV